MLTIKGSVGELRGFCEEHEDYEKYNMKISKSGLGKMSGEDCGELITDMVNDAVEYVVDSMVEASVKGVKLMLICTDTITKTSTAVLRTAGGDVFMGAAFCHDRDHFNGLLGEYLALARAIDEYFADKGLESDCENAMLEVM